MEIVEPSTESAGDESAPPTPAVPASGLRVWTAAERQFVREFGERAKPFSISAARGR